MNQRQKTFCEEYIKSGNATEAAKAAGYSVRTAYSIGQRLLKNVEVQEYIQQCNDEINAANIAKIEEIRQFWTTTMRDETAKSTDRLKASELLGRTYGVFLERFSANMVSDSDVNIYLPENFRELLNTLPDEDIKRLAELDKSAE